MVSLYFGRDVCTRLGVAISEASRPPVFHIKTGGEVPLSALPKDTVKYFLFVGLNLNCTDREPTNQRCVFSCIAVDSRQSFLLRSFN